MFRAKWAGSSHGRMGALFLRDLTPYALFYSARFPPSLY
jgi:hypothetical protein